MLTVKGFLHLAVVGGRKRVCKYLLEVGNVDINMKDWIASETPLHHAISKGHFPTIVFLLQIPFMLHLRCQGIWRIE
ncbi:hypothetical protein SLEP1_g42175 [Rubroshorea leprosula]|uniref:Ankyrin repeat protein n=2 Tax=Rubroshorea leprosula TaxID=152421 RepID=A0AAV5L8Y0_9ROSI|nr:hypothetical protein SLEP1_g42175 [Rubroshorea leprosula]